MTGLSVVRGCLAQCVSVSHNRSRSRNCGGRLDSLCLTPCHSRVGRYHIGIAGRSPVEGRKREWCRICLTQASLVPFAIRWACVASTLSCMELMLASELASCMGGSRPLETSVVRVLCPELRCVPPHSGRRAGRTHAGGEERGASASTPRVFGPSLAFTCRGWTGEKRFRRPALRR